MATAVCFAITISGIIATSVQVGQLNVGVKLQIPDGTILNPVLMGSILSGHNIEREGSSAALQQHYNLHYSRPQLLQEARWSGADSEFKRRIGFH
jgi:hypothetical protein